LTPREAASRAILKRPSDVSLRRCACRRRPFAVVAVPAWCSLTHEAADAKGSRGLLSRGDSKEQEIRQLDVAKGSLDELAGDYEAFIVDAGEAPWLKSDPRYAEVAALQLDSFAETDDVDHAYGLYTLRMRERCAKWLENEDPLVAANAQLIDLVANVGK
jgi:hypothetical protein